MKRLLTILALFGALSFAAAPVAAQDKPAESPAATAPPRRGTSARYTARPARND